MSEKSLDTAGWLRICQQCIDDCETAATTIMDLGLVDALATQLEACWECADACTMATRFIANRSPMANEVWQACAIACERCMNVCSDTDYEFCQRVVVSCRDCLELSAEMTN